MSKSWFVMAILVCVATPVRAEGPATGPSSQGGEATDVAPTGVEKPLVPSRVVPDPSEGMPPQNADAPDKLQEPKVKAEPEPDNK